MSAVWRPSSRGLRSVYVFGVYAQIYWPTVQLKKWWIYIDLDCCVRAGRNIFRDHDGFGLRLLGFGLGVIWPTTQKAKEEYEKEKISLANRKMSV